MTQERIWKPGHAAEQVRLAHAVGAMFPSPAYGPEVEARLAAALEAERIARDAELIAAAGRYRSPGTLAEKLLSRGFIPSTDPELGAVLIGGRISVSEIARLVEDGVAIDLLPDGRARVQVALEPA